MVWTRSDVGDKIIDIPFLQELGEEARPVALNFNARRAHQSRNLLRLFSPNNQPTCQETNPNSTTDLREKKNPNKISSFQMVFFRVGEGYRDGDPIVVEDQRCVRARELVCRHRCRNR